VTAPGPGLRAKDFRRIALGMKNAIEGAHMGHPDFRTNGRIFATLHADLQFGMVKLTPDQQREFVRDHPSAFAPESGAWGRQGSTAVRLAAIDEETLGEALTLAWRNVASLPPKRRK
jgi:hypothetical protein